jgi:hypothetical protein
VLLERARLALDERDLDAAQHFLDRAASAGADDAALELVLARYETMRGNTGAAREHQEKFLRLDAKRKAATRPSQP